MSDNQSTPKRQGGVYGNPQDCEPQKPPPCPDDPCDEKPEWGPPSVDPDCCPPSCCPKEERGCTWDEVEDPCIRASAASCGGDYKNITCTCEAKNQGCDWECGCYPPLGCVPCKPCEGLLPEGDGPTGGCDEPKPGDCSAGDLQTQLNALKRCISSQEGEKAKIEADIKARQEREKELAALVGSFDKITAKYKDERQKLIFTEDCLKGFHREMKKLFEKDYSDDCSLQQLQEVINTQLCLLEREKCCHKSLEQKLTKVTKLIWDQQQAEKDLKKAEDAYKIIQDLAKWIGDQFKDLEDLKAQIIAALNDPDPLQKRYAFYLFYWKFAPRLCKRFPVAICCEGDTAQQADAKATDHIGCDPGDWHPSEVSVAKLTKLICCAFDAVRKQKEKAQEANGKVEDTKRNLEFIKKQVEADEKALEDRIKSELKKLEC